MSEWTLGEVSASRLAPAKLLCFTFNPHDGAEAFQTWHEVARPLFEVGAIEALPSFHAACEYYVLDGVICNRIEYSATTHTRDSRHLRTGETDYLALHLPVHGGCARGLAGSCAFELAADRITLRDWAHPFTTVSEPLTRLGLLIPRERIVTRDFLHKRRSVMTWTLDSPSGRLLADSWLSLWKSLPDTSAEDAPALAARFVGLLNGLITQARDARPDSLPPQGLLAAMKHFLDERLSEPGLGPDGLLRAFACSRATVYRLFQECGGVQSYIRNQRLANCFQELMGPKSSRLRVHEAARRWGFTDVGYFCRVFRQQFGITPSEAAHVVSGDDSAVSPTGLFNPPDHIATLHGWLAGA